MADLRECPFCGSDDINLDPWTDTAECNTCWARGPDPSRRLGPFLEDEVDAKTREAWNRRAGEDASDG